MTYTFGTRRPSCVYVVHVELKGRMVLEVMTYASSILKEYTL